MTVISVARAGKEIGTFDLDGIKQGLTIGYFQPDDYGWHEGLTEWLLLPDLIGKLDVSHVEQPQAQTFPRRRKPRQSAKEPSPQIDPTPHHDWHKDPATEKQIAYLASFGLTAPPEITKGETSDLIDKFTKDPHALWRQDEIHEAARQEENLLRAAFPSYYLKADIISAERDLEAVKSDSGSSADDRKDARDELDFKKNVRINFWVATFRQDWALKDEDEQLLDYGDTIDALYQKGGRFFKMLIS